MPLRPDRAAVIDGLLVNIRPPREGGLDIGIIERGIGA
jgi:hypothetical protein